MGPQAESAPSNSSGDRSASSAATSPPSDAPATNVRAGWPTVALNCATSSLMSSAPSRITSPLCRYVVVAKAKPDASTNPGSDVPSASVRLANVGTGLSATYPCAKTTSDPFHAGGTQMSARAPPGRGEIGHGGTGSAAAGLAMPSAMQRRAAATSVLDARIKLLRASTTAAADDKSMPDGAPEQ